MEIGSSARWIVRLAIALLIFAAATGVWELFARQAPGSPLSVEALPGPIESLRHTATVLSLVLLAAAWLFPWAFSGREPRLVVGALFAGVALTIGAGLAGALKGMYLVQIVDPRPDAVGLFIIKTAGQLLLGVCLLDMARRIFFAPPPR